MVREGGRVFTGNDAEIGLPYHPLPPSLFFEWMPSAFHSVPSFYPGSWLVLGAALPQRLEFSIVDTFSYSSVTSEHFYSLRFGSHVFSGGGISRTVATRNDFALLGCITTSRWC